MSDGKTRNMMEEHDKSIDDLFAIAGSHKGQLDILTDFINKQFPEAMVAKLIDADEAEKQAEADKQKKRDDILAKKKALDAELAAL